jgi:hypothetical protein
MILALSCFNVVDIYMIDPNQIVHSFVAESDKILNGKNKNFIFKQIL